MLEHHGKEVVKASVSFDDNKKEFFETAPHVLKNSGLLLRSCFLNAVYSLLEILEKTETTFVSVPRKEKIVFKQPLLEISQFFYMRGCFKKFSYCHWSVF